MNTLKKILKILYTILLWELMLLYIIIRMDVYFSNSLTTLDNMILILFVIFSILPIFSEIDFMGVKLKREIEKNKIETDRELLQIKAEINNNSMHNSNVIYNYANLPDNTLKTIEKDYQSNFKIYDNFDIDNDAILCLKIRQKIEVLLKQLAEKYGVLEKNMALIPLLRILVNKEVIPNKLYGVLIEIIIICNKSIHGEKISENHSEFIRNTYSQVLLELESIK